MCADTGNNCIRLLGYREDVVRTFGDRRIAGHNDGDSSQALFHTPSGVAALTSGILICDTGTEYFQYNYLHSVNARLLRLYSYFYLISCILLLYSAVCIGNHCLRLLKREGDIWSVTTVAGMPSNPGIADGKALDDARLFSPTKGIASQDGNSVYFIEEGAFPAVREYNHVSCQITTIHRGAPLATPSSICCGENNVLYICDAGAGCIWSLDLLTKDLTMKICAENLFLHCMEFDDTKDDIVDDIKHAIQKKYLSGTSHAFTPMSIAQLFPGCYVFAEGGAHAGLYQYMEKSFIDMETQRTADTFKEVCILFHTIIMYVILMVIDDFNECFNVDVCRNLLIRKLHSESFQTKWLVIWRKYSIAYMNVKAFPNPCVVWLSLKELETNCYLCLM